MAMRRQRRLPPQRCGKRPENGTPSRRPLLPPISSVHSLTGSRSRHPKRRTPRHAAPRLHSPRVSPRVTPPRFLNRSQPSAAPIPAAKKKQAPSFPPIPLMRPVVPRADEKPVCPAAAMLPRMECPHRITATIALRRPFATYRKFGVYRAPCHVVPFIQSSSILLHFRDARGIPACFPVCVHAASTPTALAAR